MTHAPRELARVPKMADELDRSFTASRGLIGELFAPSFVMRDLLGCDVGCELI